jgi:serine/threonine-protein kinase
VADNLVVGGQLGNYLIDSVIGRGGMSVVYGAKHARLGMTVALKVLAPELSSDDKFRERFLREAQTAASLDHPNVIPIHDMGLHEDSLYIVMRYVAGGDLKALLSNAGPLDPEQALRILTPVGLALDAAHAHGLVHRDVKPANILVQRSATGSIEHVYLTDFGIAKDAAMLRSGLTADGASIGTVGYMAPEQMEGREVSAQTDQYALAVTFYECLAGRIPFQRELAEGARPPQGPLEPLTHVRPGLPGELDEGIAKALSRDPADRYGSCEEFLEACESAAVGGVTTTTPSMPASEDAHSHSAPPATPEPAPAISAVAANGREAKQRRWWPVAAAFLVLAVAAAVAVVLASGSSTPSGKLSQAPLAEVPSNHVTGSGEALVRLNGDRAAVTVTTSGLDNGAELVHLMHIHAGGKGQCPPASAARRHNGHLAISTNDGINYYGPPVQALTTHGDTSVASILAFHRFLSGGALHYTRTIVLPPSVAAAIRRGDAVVVVHGTDYDGTGIYSGVLDASELSKSVPATATAPALCGQLLAAQNASSGLYTASLDLAPALAGGAFVCQVPSAGAAAEAGERRKRAA